ncbi:MAG: M48 family metallopeptidase [Thermodesulfobacteriota bacterium]
MEPKQRRRLAGHTARSHMNPYLAAVLLALAGAWALNALAALLNLRALDPNLPPEFAGAYDPERYRKSQEYARANTRLVLLRDTLGAALLAAFILWPGFPLADAAARSLGWGELPAGLAFLLILALASELFGLPFDLYDTFVLEERFGFNRTTPATFALDKLKAWLLLLALGGPLLAAVLAFFLHAGPLAWLWAWLATMAALTAIQVLAPTLILPLFNRFTPLEDGPLRNAIQDLADRAGFALSGVFVMDGSRRSAKANAFFTGLGRRKRIALYDTLMEAHPQDQLLAVLAHEIGHFRHGHIRTRLLLSLLRLGLAFLLLSLALRQPGLHAAFGMDAVTVHGGLVFFALLYSPLSLLLSLAGNALSRRHERQADAFAARLTGDPASLARALAALSAHNLSNLTPHPLHVALHHAHPPALERVRSLNAMAAAARTPSPPTGAPGPRRP